MNDERNYSPSAESVAECENRILRSQLERWERYARKAPDEMAVIAHRNFEQVLAIGKQRDALVAAQFNDKELEFIANELYASLAAGAEHPLFERCYQKAKALRAALKGASNG
jgi:hypothetical protein